MDRAVVTGATGMIASALIRYLIGQGVHVEAVCRPGSKKIGNIPVSPLVHVHERDIADMASLADELPACGAFFHFAWGGTAGPDRNNARAQEANIRFTLDAAELAHSCGCSVFVGAGSQAEYGRYAGRLRPDTPAFPENAYGAAKLAAGQLSRISCRGYGIRHVWLRILSVYGPGDNEFTITSSSLSRFLRGEHAPFTAGEQQWDFLYCDDAARAFYLAALHGQDGAVYPLGSGKARPLREYILAMRDAAAPKAEPGFGEVPYNEGQVMYLCADIADLQRDCGFEPRVSYEEGIRLTVSHMKEEMS